MKIKNKVSRFILVLYGYFTSTMIFVYSTVSAKINVLMGMANANEHIIVSLLSYVEFYICPIFNKIISLNYSTVMNIHSKIKILKSDTICKIDFSFEPLKC